MAGYLSELEDRAAARFYEELAADRFMTTRCPACDYTFFPPRIVCPRCLGEDVEWVELEGRGTLYAFTQQHTSMVHRKPEVVGVVDLEEAEGRVFALIDASFEELDTGIPVELRFFDSPLGIKLFKFKPASG